MKFALLRFSLAVLVASVALGVGYYVGRDHGGIHCHGIYLSPQGASILHNAHVTVTLTPFGKSLAVGCQTLHHFETAR